MNIRISGYDNRRISGYRKQGYQNIRISGYQGISGYEDQLRLIMMIDLSSTGWTAVIILFLMRAFQLSLPMNLAKKHNDSKCLQKRDAGNAILNT